MIIEDQIVKVRWNGFTRKWYEDKGYKWTKNNEFFDCTLNDLHTGSTTKINLICDYCGETFIKEYRNYFSERITIQKDCCSNRKCMVQKSKEMQMILYGVDNVGKTPEQRRLRSERQRTPFGDVLQKCNEKGLILLSTEDDYNNDRSRIKIICSHHSEFGEQETNFANIKQGIGCCRYQRTELITEKLKKDGRLVHQQFIEAGFEPQFKPEDYTKNSIRLPFICTKHREKGIQYRSASNILTSEGCLYCAKERTARKLKLDENDVFIMFKKKDLIPVPGQNYINKEYPIFYRCKKHPEHIQYSSLSNFKASKQCCSYCRAEDSLTKLTRRLRSSIIPWRNESEKNSDYKCVITGSKDYDIHHLYSFVTIVEEALSILNLDDDNKYSGEEILKIRDVVLDLHIKYGLGVCLDKRLHILFHQIYGKTKTTPEQFNQFRDDYNNGKFEDVLSQSSSF